MKLVLKDISEKDGQGRVILIPEEPEDMWHVYNLLVQGDRVRATTFRKVVTEGSTGSTKADKKRVTLTVEVEGIEFDPVEGMIRARGRNKSDTKFVRLNAYHTLELEINRKIEVAPPPPVRRKAAMAPTTIDP